MTPVTIQDFFVGHLALQYPAAGVRAVGFGSGCSTAICLKAIRIKATRLEAICLTTTILGLPAELKPQRRPLFALHRAGEFLSPCRLDLCRGQLIAIVEKR
jgi:hypothetical protein